MFTSLFSLARETRVKFASRLSRRASSYHVLFFCSTLLWNIHLRRRAYTELGCIRCHVYVLSSRYTRPRHSVNNEATPGNTQKRWKVPRKRGSNSRIPSSSFRKIWNPLREGSNVNRRLHVRILFEHV